MRELAVMPDDLALRGLGLVLFVVGFAGILWTAAALTFRSWAGVVGVALLAIIFLWRIHDEESPLAREFGSQWRAYAGRSWRLVPLLY